VWSSLIAFLLFEVSGGSRNGGGAPELVLGFVVLIVALILLSPFALSVLAKVAGGAPIAVRLALRDLARYRARSGSALGAISLGVLIAVVISVVAAARYGNVLDWAGPNVASNQIVVYTPNGPNQGGGPVNGKSGGAPKAPNLKSLATRAHAIATGLGSHDIVELESTSATLQHVGSGRNYSGSLYVATPQLLRAFGISPSSVNPNADILSMRPGLAGISNMQLVYANYFSPNGPGGGGGGGEQLQVPCPPSVCLANPVMQTVGALPAGTSAPNTVITEHAIAQLHLQTSVSGWIIQTPRPPTAAQITGARQAAAAAGMTIETKNSQPTSAEIINWATVFGMALALGILAMTIGLIRSETAGDLRTLAATGASSATRRTLTAATAGALALLGAVLGTAGGYVAAAGWFRSSSLNGGLSALGSVPAANLLIILLGMPLLAVVGGWLFAGREPPTMVHQPLE